MQCGAGVVVAVVDCGNLHNTERVVFCVIDIGSVHEAELGSWTEQGFFHRRSPLRCGIEYKTSDCVRKDV